MVVSSHRMDDRQHEPLMVYEWIHCVLIEDCIDIQ